MSAGTGHPPTLGGTGGLDKAFVAVRLSPMRSALLAVTVLLAASLSADAEPQAASPDEISRALGGDYWKPQAQREPAAPTVADAAKTAPRQQPDLAYLSDLLRDDEHRFAYNRMLSAAYELPRWFRKFNADRDGMAFPVEVKIVAGRRYEFAQVCKPRDAGQNCVLVVFDVGTDEGPVAWGLIRDGEGAEWWGRPPASVKRAAEAYEPS